MVINFLTDPLTVNFRVLQNITTVTGLVITRLKNESAQVMLDYDN